VFPVKNQEKIVKQKTNRKGLCVICGDRVKGKEEYIESSEGYCHRNCIIAETKPKAAMA
jgi:hypothetical protein